MSDWRSLGWYSGRLLDSELLKNQGIADDDGYLPLEGAHIAPVTLYFRNTQTSGIGTKYDAISTAGTSGDTSVTTTTASGTEIQATKTAGGSVVEFISGRTPVGGATFTRAVIYFWAKQSAATVNAGLRFRLYKRSTAGVETELTGSPFDKTVELTTANTRYEITCDFTDVALLEDERIVIKPYIVNVGTMGAGTATLRFNGAATALTGAISTLTVTNSGTTTVDLTALGGADYHIYDATAALNVGQRKATGGSSITVAEYDPGSAYTQDSEVKSRTASASDATPTTSFSDNDAARMFNATALQEGGFQVILPAGLGERTAKIYVQAYHGSLTSNSFQAVAMLSDGSAADVVVDYAVPATGTDYYLTIDVTYKSALENQTLTLVWKFIAVGSATTRAVHYLASWVSAEGTPPELQAGSYVNVYPAVTFKAESGGAVNADITESLASSESSSALAAFSASTTESIATSETESAIASFGVSASESVAASELASVSVNTFVEITEAATASETSSAGLLSTGDVTEAATASEAQSATVTHAASIAETVIAAEAQSAQANFIADSTESVSTDSSQSSTIITEALITEQITATETSNFGSASSSADITESISIVADQSAISQLQSAITETITAGESSGNTLVANASITESVTSDSTQTTSFVGNSDITESITASETSSATSSGASSLSGNYTNETTAVNLTNLGAEDAHSYDSSGTAIIKTGGGSLITVTGYNYSTTSSEAYSGNTGGFQSRQFTTTDFTASNITNKADCVFMSMTNILSKGIQLIAPAGLGERTLKVYLAHFLPTGTTETLHCIAHVSGTGAPSDIDLTPSIDAGSDRDLTVTFTYKAGQAGQTITIDFYPETSAASGTRYIGYRGSWISAESSSAQSASITETITSSESSSSQAVFTPSITETLTMSVIESANYSTPATITESSSADSSQDSSLGSTNLYSDIEEIFASDELSVATYQTNSNIIEITSVIDASFTYNIIVADVTESVNLTDTYSVIVKLVKRAVSSVLAIRDLGTGLVKRVLSSNLTERDVDSNLTKRDVDSNLDEREP